MEHVLNSIFFLIIGAVCGYFIGWARGFNQASEAAQRTYYAFIDTIKKAMEEERNGPLV